MASLHYNGTGFWYNSTCFLKLISLSAYNKSQQVQFVPKELSSIVKHREKAVAAAAAAASSSSQSSSIARETIAARESSI